MPTLEVLPGLPPYGPMAKPFPASRWGAHREAYVVKFSLNSGGSWTGNFQPGLTTFSTVCVHPDGKHVLVVSGGRVYVVDPDTETAAHDFSGMVKSIFPVPELNALLLDEVVWQSLGRPNNRGGVRERLVVA